MARWTSVDGKKVSVLGTEYTIRVAKPSDCIECDGWCDFSTKEVFVKDFEPDPMSMANLEWYTEKVLRHELVHAFMYESGRHCNSNFGMDEELVDFIAIMFPKMLSTFKEANALD